MSGKNHARKAAMKAIDDARKASTVTVDEEQKMIMDAYRYPTRLSATVAHLPLEDALDVYAAGSRQEKREIRRAVASNVESYYKLVEQEKKSNAEYNAMAPKIKQFFQDRP